MSSSKHIDVRIIAPRQMKAGDYIKPDSGGEGYITDITWRTTKTKMLPNNAILALNEKLTKGMATNYYLPDKEIARKISERGDNYTLSRKNLAL